MSHTEKLPVLPGQGPRRFVVALLALIAVDIIALFIGPEGRMLAAAGATVLPFALLAGLSYAGENERRPRTLALALLCLVIGLAAAAFLGQSAELLERTATPGRGAELAAIAAVMTVGLILAAAALTPPGRRAASRLVPMDPSRFTHAVALSLTLGITACALAPLIVLGQPILTSLVALETSSTTETQTGLHAELYHLYWLIPVSVLAVGYGIRRSFAQALARLGLTRPSARQIGLSVVIAVLLVIGVIAFHAAVDQIWRAMGWPRTDTESFNRLMGDLITPTGAVVIAFSAGLGEEIVVRGVLQPRLGLALSNLLFTALHAGQYSWDYLIVILGLGLCFGLVRKHGSTTMSAIVHGVYDLLIVLMAVSAQGSP